MSRHHGYWKSPCSSCANFVENKCNTQKLRFKKFDVLKLDYADIEIPVFHNVEGGTLIKILPNMSFVSHHTWCSIFESWLNNTMEKLKLNLSDTKSTVSRCDSYEEYRYN